MTLSIGDTAPPFRAQTDRGQTVSLADCAGKFVILYFYPKDDTPGCTVEACGFRDDLPAFEGLNAVIFGVSRDSVASHAKFRDKYDLTFPLLADDDGSITEGYGVWVEKSMYGKKYMGIDRATFLIGPDGRIVQVWRKVKVPGHVDAVRAALEAAVAAPA